MRPKVLHILPKRQLKEFERRAYSATEPVFITQSALGRWALLRRCRPVPEEVWFCHFERKRRLHRILAFRFFIWLYQLFLRRYAAAAAEDFLAIRKNIGADAVWVNNGNRLPMSAVSYAANEHGISCFHVEKGLLPKTLCVDLNGVNAKNSLPLNLEFYKPYARQAERFDGGDAIPAVATKRRYNDSQTELPNDFVFIPLQINYDTQMIIHSGWVRTVSNFVSEVVALAAELPEKTFVIKEHPLSKECLDQAWRGRLPENVKFFNAESTDKLLRLASVVVLVNSTMGVEALLLNKKVIVLGEACYNIESLVMMASSRNELKKRILSACDWTVCPEVRKGYLQFLKQHYLVAKEPSESFVERLDNKMLTLLQSGNSYSS